MIKISNQKRGQSLITLLFFVIIATSIMMAAAMVLISGSASGTRIEKGNEEYFLAESGVENALLRLVRDPAYSGETLEIPDGTAIIEITQANPPIILSTATVGDSVKKIQAETIYNNDVLTVSSWKEVY